MTSSSLLDVNVWLALTSSRHVHNAEAVRWWNSIGDARVFFCRLTQLGLLRLLTTRLVMGNEVVGQGAAWAVYHRWRQDDRVRFCTEPDTPELEKLFHRFSKGPHSSPRLWTDAYLAAFASVAGLTLVTFDRALGALVPGRSMVLS
jgi:toxin-antitoxin system PIN domain toxin